MLTTNGLFIFFVSSLDIYGRISYNNYNERK